MANETDLAGIIEFMASDASGYITGTNIPVDAGYTAEVRGNSRILNSEVGRWGRGCCNLEFCLEFLWRWM